MHPLKTILPLLGILAVPGQLLAQEQILSDSLITDPKQEFRIYDSKVSSLELYPYTTNLSHQLSVGTTGIRSNSPSLPGMSTQLAIRGFSNIYYEQMPAIVVDGNLYRGSLSSINPYTIETLKVINNPFESTLPLGLTADGVIEITTKKLAAQNKWQFNFNTNAGIVGRGVKEYDVFTDAGSFYEMLYLASSSHLFQYGTSWEQAKIIGAEYMENLSGLNQRYDIPNRELIDVSTGKFNRNARPLYEDDFANRFYRKNGFRNQHNLIATKSFKTGYLSINSGYLKERTFVKEADFNRFNAGLNAAWNPIKKLTIGLNASYAQHTLSAIEIPFNLDQYNSPLTDYYTRDINGNKIQTVQGTDSLSRIAYMSKTFLNAPLTTSIISVNPYLEYQFTDQLKLAVRLSYNAENVSSEKHYYRLFSFEYGNDLLQLSYRQLNLNPSLSWSGRKGKHLWNSALQFSHIAHQQTLTRKLRSTSAYLNFDEDFDYQNSNLDWNVAYIFNQSIGFNARINYEENTNENARKNNLAYNALNYALGLHYSIFKPQKNNAHFLIFADYAQQKNFMHFNNERSTAMYEGNVNPYQFIYSYFAPTPSSQQSFTLGLKGSIPDRQLQFRANYFIRNITASRYWQPILGSYFINDGINIRNSGFEFSLQSDILTGKDWRWHTGLNATHFSNKLDGHFFEHSSLWNYKSGEALQTLYLPEWVGVDPQNGRSLYAKMDGSITYDYQMITPDDLKAYRAAPFLFGSFTNRVQWKNLSIGFSLNYSVGGKVLDIDYMNLMQSNRFLSGQNNVHKDMLKSWTPDNPNNEYPAINGFHSYNPWSSYFLTDASWLSIKNVNIQYSFPKRMFNNRSIRGISAYLFADNLFLFSHRQGLDPNTNFQGMKSAQYPMMRTILLGFNLDF